MTVRAFLDTNILVYGLDAHPSSAEKRRRSVSILMQRDYDFVISGQVLGELFVTATRKLPHPLQHLHAARALSELAPLETVPIDRDLVAAALGTSEEAQLSYWDALIVEAAARAKCEVLLTEDLNAGAIISGVRIVNPFS